MRRGPRNREGGRERRMERRTGGQTVRECEEEWRGKREKAEKDLLFVNRKAGRILHPQKLSAGISRRVSFSSRAYPDDTSVDALIAISIHPEKSKIHRSTIDGYSLDLATG